ncbi:MAG: GNAT family N-acetyltransferase [Rikenellaceae bacterium]
MIEFSPITIYDKEHIESYTKHSKIRSCDLSFANMYCWQTLLQSAYAIVDGYLLIRFRISGGDKLGYMLPMSGDGEVDFGHIIPLLAQDAHSHGQRLHIIGLTHEGGERLKDSFSSQFALFNDLSNEDYIYLRESLCSLSGKKLQPKRNHINQFRKLYPQFEYRELTPEMFDDCMVLDCRWRATHGTHCGGDTPEREAMQRAFDHFEQLGICGGAIYIDGQMAAFTYGSPINDDTFCIHVEKGDNQITGCYTAINQLFAQSLPDTYRYINREEDMGIEGLRRAKQSYYPDHKQEKQIAIHLHHDELECKKLWQSIFGDSDEFIDEFLIHHYSNHNMIRMADRDNRYMAMLHAIPFTSEHGTVVYIYAVATAPEHRKRGYAAQLLQLAIERAQKSRAKAVVLIPSSDDLRRYYAKLGFSDGAMLTFKAYNNFDFGEENPEDNRSMIYPIEDDFPLEIETLHLTK